MVLHVIVAEDRDDGRVREFLPQEIHKLRVRQYLHVCAPAFRIKIGGKGGVVPAEVPSDEYDVLFAMILDESIQHRIEEQIGRVAAVAAHRRRDICQRARICPAVSFIVDLWTIVLVILHVQVQVTEQSNLECCVLTQLTHSGGPDF